MSGIQIVLLVVLLVFWLFVGAGIATNYVGLWFSLTAKEGQRVPSGVMLVFGFLGAVLAHFSIRFLKTGFGIEIQWPWLWVALPLILDPQGLLFLAFMYLRYGFPKNTGGTR